MSGLMLLALIMAVPVQAKKKGEKKVQKFKITRDIDLSADKVWEIVGEDYGAIAHSHPLIVSSDYINGTMTAGEGAERVCHFNEKGIKFLKEKMLDYDPANMQFTNQVSQAGKFPVDPDLTRAVYKVEDLGNGKSRVSFDMQYRTKPAFMGAMAKGKFKKLIRNYLIAVEHYGTTGESVTKQNFKKIKKQYS